MANETQEQGLHMDNVGRIYGLPTGDFVYERDIAALRGFFLQERDEQLGRWRWPENPDYVVYPDGTSRRVVKESNGTNMSVSLFDRERMETYLDSYVGAALAYDAAHPEPKPWEVDPKFGDAWAFKSADSDRELLAVWRATNGGELRWAATDGLVNLAEFSSGRKVWSAS